jgi:hypothetical protein
VLFGAKAFLNPVVQSFYFQAELLDSPADLTGESVVE